MPLNRLAELYGVATAYSPAPGRVVRVPPDAVRAALAALGVDADRPDRVAAALAARETELRERLLPPTLVWWPDRPPPPELDALPPGTRLRLVPEDGPGDDPAGYGTGTAEGDPAGYGAGAVEGDTAGVTDGTGDGGTGAADEPAPTSWTPWTARSVRAAGEPRRTRTVWTTRKTGAARTARSTSASAQRHAPDGQVPDGQVPWSGPAPGPLPGSGPAPARGTPEPGAVPVLPGALPYGVHALTVTVPDGRTVTAHLVVPPARAPAPGARAYGFLVQLYSLLSHRSWGLGDLGDLTDLVTWAGRTLGAGFVQVNPLHAAVPGAPTDPSPYRPSSRRFPDPVHLRIEDVDEYTRLDPAARARVDDLAARAAALRAGVLSGAELIDRDAVRALKHQALELLHAVEPTPGRRAAHDGFAAREGTALEDHATWCALAERHGPDWRTWPDGLDDPRSAATARARERLRDRVAFHRWLVWLTELQLGAAQRAARTAGMPVGVVHDLAVGVHPHGADTWAGRDHFATGVSVGAPPDGFDPRGQDWGLPPWRPDRLAASGYAPFRRLLRGLFRHAGALRVDHVMGLFRLWWVPEGRPPAEGTYVHHDAGAMLAVLVLEAHRAGALVIGEDLGTVAPGVREALRERGVLGTSVLWFERAWDADPARPLPPGEWRADCLATATTHDLPPTAARLTGADVDLRDSLGLLSGPPAEARAAADRERAEWLALFVRLGLLSPEAARDPGAGAEEERVRAVHRFLSSTPARLVGVWLPDAVGDRRPQNLPGTWREYPNWRLPVADGAGRPLTLEDLMATDRLHALIGVLRGAVPARVPPDA
ncbi:4-alpha-glucanotransferase [Streptomyces sp. JNUCC 64]